MHSVGAPVPGPYETVLVDRPNEGVARILLNRPARRNAINVQMMLDLETAFRQFEHDPDVRVVVLGATGDSFSSGHELDRTPALDAEWEARRATSEGRYLVEEELYYSKSLYLRDYPKPTIAVVHGPAVAAGWTLASVCDLVVASSKARFQNPMCRMAASGPFLLVEPWDLNVRKAKELLFTGDWLSAQEARDFGFVNQIFSDDALEAESLKLASRIAEMPAWAVRLVKRSLNNVLDQMGQRTSWEHQFVVRQLGHASTERGELLGKLKKEKSVRGFINARDKKFGKVPDDGSRKS